MILTLERNLLTFAPLTATPYRDGLRIRRSSLRTNVLLRALTVVPSRNSDARSVMLRIPLPEYANGTLYIIQEVSSNDYDLSQSTDKHPRGQRPIWVWPSPPPRCGRAPSVVSGKSTGGRCAWRFGVWLLYRRGMSGKKYHSGEGGGLVYFSNPLIRGVFLEPFKIRQYYAVGTSIFRYALDVARCRRCRSHNH